MTHMMTNNQTDFRALCAEVLAFNNGESPYNFSGLTPYDRDIAAFDAWQDIRQRLKSALRLAQPEPEGPTDEELEATARAAELQYSKEHGGIAATTPDGIYAQLQAQRLAGLRAVAARWGSPPSTANHSANPTH